MGIANRLRPLMTLVLMVVVIAGAFLAYQWFAAKQNPTAAVVPETEAETEPDQETPEEELVFAGDFTVYDMAGNEVKLSDFRGQPLVVNFWASWCPPCVGEMPDFNQVWQDRQEDVMFMMVNVVDGQRETEESGKEYFRNEGYSFPVYFDLDQDAVATFGIYSYPQSFFIDKHGYFVAYAKGAIDADTLKMAIDMTIEAGEKRQPPPEAGETAPRAAY